MLFLFVIFVALGLAAVGLVIDGLWWLMLVALGLVVAASVIAVLLPGRLGGFRSRRPADLTFSPSGGHEDADPGGYEAWTKEELLRPTHESNINALQNAEERSGNETV